MDDPAGNSPRGTIAALIVLAVLVVGGIWLQQHIRAMARIQDCVMAGRTNCAAVGG